MTIFDLACQMVVQLIELLPLLIVLWLLFDLLGSFFFDKK